MNTAFSIEDKTIGPGQPVFIISEAGVNHNGSVELATKLIEESAKCGADCVKFQTFRAERVAMADAPKAAYQLEATDSTESQINMLRKLELPDDCYRTLIETSRKNGVVFLSTPYNEEDVDFLVEVGAPALKLASIHTAEPSMVRYAAQTGLPLILSTGMATLEEVATAVDLIRSVGNEKFVIMQCTTNYPSDVSDSNVKAMVTMADTCGVAVGYSDHTQTETSAIAAVALGACILEKHFTLDPGLDGPDQSASLDQAGLRTYIQAVRETEEAMGDGVKQPASNEIPNIEGMRRSIVTRRAINPGSEITPQDLIMKRPATGITGRHWDDVIGCKAVRAIPEGRQLTWADLDGRES